jgi:hypothetical protein
MNPQELAGYDAKPLAFPPDQELAPKQGSAQRNREAQEYVSYKV